MPATYTVKQVADILGYSTNSIYTFLKEKRIKGVRVGKGRFRIPQSEMNRLLAEKSPKKGTVTPTAGTPSTIALAPAGNGMVIDHGVVEPGALPPTLHAVPLVGRVMLTLPSLFDWFLGLSAFITGLALFLFNTSFGTTTTTQYAPYIAGMRLVLILTGIGLLLTTYTGRGKSLWHIIFRVALMVVGMVLPTILWKTGDISGALVYGALAASIAIATVGNLGSIASVCLYLILLAAIGPFAMAWGQADVHVQQFLSVTYLSQPVAIVVVGISAVLFAVGLWVGYRYQRILFWLLAFLAGFILSVLSFSFAQRGYWSRAFFFIILGTASMFLPGWSLLAFVRSRRQLLFVHTVLAGIGAILVGAIVGVRFMQVAVISSTKQELTSKVEFAANELENRLSSVGQTLEASAHNPQLVTALVKKDTATLNILSRTLFESNDNLRRIVFLNKEGDGVLLYPFGTFDLPNYAFRDYFIQVRQTKKLYVSDVFEALADQSKRKVVVVAVPLLDEKAQFAGVLAGSLALDTIGARLQKLTVTQRGEYLMVADKAGLRVISPDSSLLGKPVDPSDQSMLGVKGLRGVAEGSTVDGQRALVAHDTVEGLGWGITLKVPLASVSRLTDQASIAVFALMVVAAMAGGGLVFWLRALSRREVPTLVLRKDTS